MTRAKDAVFTPFETPVELAVPAQPVMTVLGTAQARVARVGASWAAQNHPTGVGLGLAPPTD